jgi:multimeric flavodoxin WrbA
MKVVGINSSPHKDGNTSLLINAVFQELEKQGIETEQIHIGGTAVRGCTGCWKCGKQRNMRCVFDEDIINDCIAKLTAADGFILGSPCYFTDVTAEMKAFIDRVGMVSLTNGGILKHKASGCVVAVRRGGAIHAFDTMNHFLHYMQTFMVGASYWNMAYGLKIGDVNKDEEGLQNMKTLGENMACLLKKLKA